MKPVKTLKYLAMAHDDKSILHAVNSGQTLPELNASISAVREGDGPRYIYTLTHVIEEREEKSAASVLKFGDTFKTRRGDTAVFLRRCNDATTIPLIFSIYYKSGTVDNVRFSEQGRLASSCPCDGDILNIPQYTTVKTVGIFPVE